MPAAPLGDTYRLVLDESGFDLGAHDDEQVHRAVVELNDLLEELSSGPHQVAVWSELYETACRDGLLLHDLLFNPELSPLDRTERYRLMQALTKLPHWDDHAPDGVPLEVCFDGAPERVFAPTVGYALLASTNRSSVACVRLPLKGPGGKRRVSGSCGEAEVYFCSSGDTLPEFWRWTIIADRVDEPEFFRRGRDAFPNLVLHRDLSFRTFDGHYADLREPVLLALALINDSFGQVMHEAKGQPHEIEVRMRSLGVVMTRESVKTRASPKHMAMRDVGHDGRHHRCEWHAKLEPHRNRIHFSLPDPALAGRILIGLFADHLPTA